MSPTVNPQHTQALMDLLTNAPYFSLLGMRFEACVPLWLCTPNWQKAGI